MLQTAQMLVSVMLQCMAAGTTYEHIRGVLRDVRLHRTTSVTIYEINHSTNVKPTHAVAVACPAGCRASVNSIECVGGPSCHAADTPSRRRPSARHRAPWDSADCRCPPARPPTHCIASPPARNLIVRNTHRPPRASRRRPPATPATVDMASTADLLHQRHYRTPAEPPQRSLCISSFEQSYSRHWRSISLDVRFG